MYEVQIDTIEKASCRCQNCSWTEDDSGHTEVVTGASHSAEHAIITGHTVVEEQVKTMTVIPGEQDG
jgi:hypothetical protein